MPVIHTSPSVNVIERDQSGFTVPPTKTSLALIGEATKGPINTPTGIADKNNFINTFGNYGGLAAPYGIFAAFEFLKQSSNLTFIRSAYDATVQFTGTVQHPFTTTATTNKLKIAENGATAGTTVTIPTFASVTAAVAASRITDALSDSSISASAIENASNKIDLVATNTIHKLELQSVTNDAYDLFGWATVSASVERAWKARKALTLTTAPRLETGNVSALSWIAGSNLISITQNGSSNSAIFELPSTLDGTQPGSTIASRIVSSLTLQKSFKDASLNLSYDFSAIDTGTSWKVGIVGSSLVTLSLAAIPISGDAYQQLGGDFTAVVGTSSVTSNESAVTVGTVYAATEGTDGNNLSIAYSINSFNENQIDVTYTVNGKISATETISGFNFDETDTDNYIEVKVAADSDFITVDWTVDATDDFDKKTYSLADGRNGINDTMTTERIAAFNSTDITNPELFDINLISAPGESSTAAINALIDFCENQRADCMAIVDSPRGLDADDIVDWHNGTGGGNTTSFNSSYAALYWPWMSTTILNPSTTTIFFPPSSYIAGKYAFNDNVADPWFAPAGESRGKVIAEEMDYDASIGQRDVMYGRAGNNVNPVVNFTGVGKVIWGQKTLLRTASALDRVNVRRMVLFAEKGIASIAKPYIFEPAIPATWQSFTERANAFLNNIQKRYGLVEFKVICDSTTNTPDIIDQNKMVGKIFLRPVKSIEVIDLFFTITASGSAFTE